MNLKLIYYYNLHCGSCSTYIDVVEKLSKVFGIDLEMYNIDFGKPEDKLEGIPTLILKNNDVEIWRSIGNVPFQQVYKDLKDFV